MTRPITFRAHDDQDDGLFVTVNIYPTPEEMHAAYRRWDWWHPDAEPTDGNTWDGLCAIRDVVKVDRRGGERVSPNLGRVFLHRGALGTETVTHEMVHAAAGLWRRRHPGKGEVGQRVVIAGMPSEEELCYSVGSLMRCVVQKMYDRKMYDDIIQTEDERGPSR